MRAMVLEQPGAPLVPRQLEPASLGTGQVRLRVTACGVCRTDLHLLDGELPHPKLPIIPGHEVVGIVVDAAPDVALTPGTRVGVPWLGWTCERCEQCLAGRENLCEAALFTGYTVDGGYADAIVCDARYCFPLELPLSDVEAAPLLCAGLIGYRSLRLAGDATHLGIYGFGAAAHIIAQVAIQQGREVYAFVRPGDDETRRFAQRLGVTWAGHSEQAPPRALDACLVFAPVGALVPAALRVTRPGGTVVCGGIHMSDIPSFPYELLWRERSVRSVANLTRQDGVEFFEHVARHPIATHVHSYAMDDANRALDDLRHGRFDGAAVLVP